jgi:replicative DNA helicase
LPPNPPRYAIAKKDKGGSIAYPHINQPLTQRELERAIAGESAPLGIFLIGERGLVRAGCIDIDCPRDAEDLPDAWALIKRLQEIALEANLRPLIELSASRGYHFWLCSNSPLSANIMQNALKNLAAKAGFNPEEIFPNHPQKESKCIKLPGVINLKSGKLCGFVNPSTHTPSLPHVSLEEMVEVLEAYSPSQNEAIEALASLGGADIPSSTRVTPNPTSPTEIGEKLKAIGGHPACINHLANHGAPLEVDYNYSNITIARYVNSKGLDDEEAIALASEMATSTSPDHPTSKDYEGKVSNFKSVLSSATNNPEAYQFHCSYIFDKLGDEKPSSRGCIGSNCPIYSLPKPNIQPEASSNPLNRLIFESLMELSIEGKEVCKSQILAYVENKLKDNKQPPQIKHTVSPSQQLQESEILAYLIQYPEELEGLIDVYPNGFQSLTSTPPLEHLDYLYSISYPTSETIADYLAAVQGRGVRGEVKEVHKAYEGGLIQLSVLKEKVTEIDDKAIFKQSEGFNCDYVSDMVANIYENNTQPLPSFSSHLNALLSGGFKQKHLYVIGAPPGSGKSTLLNQQCDFLNARNYRTLLVSFEMGREQIFINSLSRIGRINSQKFNYFVGMNKEVSDALNTYNEHIANNQMIIEGDYSHTPAKIKAIAKRANVDLIAIDYLQQVPTGDPRLDDSPNVTNKVSIIAEGLRQLARDLNVPVIAISDINKDAYEKAITGKGMDLGALRDSFKISHAGSAIMVLLSGGMGKTKGEGIPGDVLDYLCTKYPDRKKQYDLMRINYPHNDELNDTWATLEILKNRVGLTGNTVYHYSRAIHSFKPIDIQSTK